MSRAQKVWLNGVELASVHPKILVQQIDEGGLEYKQQTAERYGGGTFLFANQATRRQIDISIAIREGLDWPTRVGVYQAVCDWAREGWLELSSHPDQKIYVYCTKLPDLGRLRDWTHDLVITFQSLWFPYWMDAAGVRLPTLTATSGVITGTYQGSRVGLLDLNVISNNTNLTTFKAWTNDNDAITLDFSDRPIWAGQPFKFTHDKHGLLTISTGTRSLMGNRSLDSADDFSPVPPTVNIHFECNVSVTVTATLWGCYV